MGERLHLRKTGTDGIDLLGGTLYLERGKWQPQSSPINAPLSALPFGALPVFGNFEPVIEVIDLVARGSLAEISAAEAAIHGVLDDAREYFIDPFEENAVWLEWETEGEPSGSSGIAKQSLIYDGILQLNQKEGMAGPFLKGGCFARLVLRRHPFWENPDQSSITDTGVTCDADLIDLTSIANLGTAPARIARLLTEGDSGSGGPIYRWWAGIRKRYDGITDFDPRWECEDCNILGTDTSLQSDGTASGSSKIQCTFATQEALLQRGAINLDDVLASGNYEHFVGNYLVLGRFKATAASTTIGVQIGFSFAGSAARQFAEEVFLNYTNWRLVELGLITIPPAGGYRSENPYRTELGNFQIVLYAERLEGSGYLDMDVLYLVPADHLIRIDHSDTGLASEDTRGQMIFTLAHDEQFGFAEQGAGLPYTDLAASITNWYLPRDPGFVIYVGERETQHVLTDNIDLTLYYLPRWRLFRNV